MKLLPALMLLCGLAFSALSQALSDLDYLPDDVTYDPAIPTPESILGSPVGEWHVRHDQLVSYMQVLAQYSPRISIVEMGRTHENRPLLLLAFTSPENQPNLESIRTDHLEGLKSGNRAGDKSPLIIWMGYSVHGNEPSGSNASMLVAYYLAAGRGEKVESLLRDNVVLLDPSLNPDGLSRFAQWANMHKGKNLVADRHHREHVEGWPSGRTNHYWFDLNRDWLLLTHPESQARIKQFHRWRPHVLTDFHEMGTNSSYFFQPGVPSRKNPWTPDKNVELTGKLAQFHAAALDSDKQLYFTQEGFDDFYYGKGSTYPDAHGSIGILFEQASSRGHLQESINGPLSFPRTIQNQVTTSLSTFAGALAHKQDLLAYQTEFRRDTLSLRDKDKVKGYLVQANQDPDRLEAFLSLLRQHQIQYSSLKQNVKEGDVTFDAAQSVYIPVDQDQYRLIKSIFSERKRFNDNTFYDVSNWNLALAFNLEFRASNKSLKKALAEPKVLKRVSNQLNPDAYAYAFSWQHYRAPELLQALLEQGVNVRAAQEAFSATTEQGQISFQPGTMLVPLALEQPMDLHSIVEKEASRRNIKIWSVTSGLTQQGIDLGSRKVQSVALPRLLLVGGAGTSQYEVGEVWHYLDQRLGLPATIVELDRLERIELSGYTHLVWVDGDYASVAETTVQKIGDWVKRGGILIGQKSATRWFADKKWLKASYLKEREVKDAFDHSLVKYADKEAFAAKQRIAGAVFEAQIDLSHPLMFGYPRDHLPMFKNSTHIMLMPEKPFVTAAQYRNEALRAGYTSDELQKLINNSAAVVAHNVGRGRVIGIVDNVNFRGYWYGTSRLMANAIYLSMFIDAQG